MDATIQRCNNCGIRKGTAAEARQRLTPEYLSMIMTAPTEILTLAGEARCWHGSEMLCKAYHDFEKQDALERIKDQIINYCHSCSQPVDGHKRKRFNVRAICRGCIMLNDPIGDSDG